MAFVTYFICFQIDCQTGYHWGRNMNFTLLTLSNLQLLGKKLVIFAKKNSHLVYKTCWDCTPCDINYLCRRKRWPETIWYLIAEEIKSFLQHNVFWLFVEEHNIRAKVLDDYKIQLFFLEKSGSWRGNGDGKIVWKLRELLNLKLKSHYSL